jgi:hypothetical protein
MAQSSKTKLREGRLLVEFTDLFASVKRMFDGYHPERHYMRGPGPAWRIKNAAARESGGLLVASVSQFARIG